MKEDWKDRMVALLNEMNDAQCAGMIPCMIFAACEECNANSDAQLGKWIVKAFMK